MIWKASNFYIALLVGPLLLTVFHFSCNREVTPEYASLNPETEYVGMETCRQCHADVYATFSKTGMGLSFDKATKQKSAGEFESHKPVYDRFKNLYYYPFWKEDTLFFLEYRLQGADTIHKRIEPINFIIGSGQHTNSHLIDRNGYVFQAPMTFYTQRHQWDLPPGFEDGHNSRFDRVIELECMSCHNAYPDFVKGSRNKFNKIKTGIDCERCHGPGAQHVKDKMEGKLVDVSKGIDYSIVNPSKLSADLQFDVCLRCHLQGNAVLNEGKSFYDFRPAMPLSDIVNVFVPVYSGDNHEHIMASHAERLKMSNCYLKTKDNNSEAKNGKSFFHNKTLTCITCHNPHVSVKVTSDEQYNTACKSCHYSNDEQHGCTAQSSILQSESFNCIKCHMPSTGTTDIPHVQATDHYIRKPVSNTKVDKIRKFTGITAVNNPQPTGWSRGMAFIQFFEKFSYEPWALDSALNYFPFQSQSSLTKNIEPLIHIFYLRKNFKQIVEWEKLLPNLKERFSQKTYNNQHALCCYRIGYAYEQLGNSAKALEYYSQAVTLAPYFPDLQIAYAGVLTASGDSLKAIEVYDHLLREQPFNIRALANGGYLKLAVKKEVLVAKEYFERAIALDPDYLIARYNLAGLYLYKDNLAGAKEVLLQILNQHPEDARARNILNSLTP
ncbi:MAG: tetratricopeptide repeat protein [Bacteroidia bacterium]|nr:tetratricopeptide repeat protein [Bacteroidia bacterium]